MERPAEKPVDRTSACHQVIDCARRLVGLGLNHGSSGNVSLRLDRERFLVTPSGVPVEALFPDSLVEMTVSGEILRGRLEPSSEWHFHAALLRQRPEFSAVIHTHASFCTTLAVMQRDIPPFHYMIAKAGGETIRCAPYATFGTAALSDHALAAMQDRKACLLAHHGMIAAGSSLEDALSVAVEVEDLARLYWQALQLGEPSLLPAEEMARVIEKFKTYGKPREPSSS